MDRERTLGADTKNVIDLLDTIEEMVEKSRPMLFTDKIFIDSKDLMQCIDLIKKSLPEDLIEAKWIREERESILAQAKSDYEKIIRGAQEEAKEKVSAHAITQEAKAVAEKIYAEADNYQRDKMLQTYEYINHMFTEFKETMADVRSKHVNQMYEEITEHYAKMEEVMDKNTNHLHELADKVHSQSPASHKIDVKFMEEE